MPQEQKMLYLKCPLCVNLMNRFNFAHRSGVVMEKCQKHGIWLDRDDLRRIIEFIRSGGLAIAREAEIERLKRERAELEAEVRQAGASPSGLGRV
jgi:Zn-finger nucleic acid-binding protein